MLSLLQLKSIYLFSLFLLLLFSYTNASTWNQPLFDYKMGNLASFVGPVSNQTITVVYTPASNIILFDGILISSTGSMILDGFIEGDDSLVSVNLSTGKDTWIDSSSFYPIEYYVVDLKGNVLFSTLNGTDETVKIQFLSSNGEQIGSIRGYFGPDVIISPNNDVMVTDGVAATSCYVTDWQTTPTLTSCIEGGYPVAVDDDNWRFIENSFFWEDVVMAFPPNETEPAWTHQTNGSTIINGIIGAVWQQQNVLLYAIIYRDGSTLFAFDLHSGTIVWQTETKDTDFDTITVTPNGLFYLWVADDEFKSTPLIFNSKGKFVKYSDLDPPILCDSDGNIYGVNSLSKNIEARDSNENLLFTYPITDPIFVHMILGEGILYVRDDRGKNDIVSIQ